MYKGNVCSRAEISSWYPFRERTVRRRKTKFNDKLVDDYICDHSSLIMLLQISLFISSCDQNNQGTSRFSNMTFRLAPIW